MKLGLATAVVAGLVPAPAARPGRVPGVDSFYADTPPLGLVGEEGPEGGEAPGVQPALVPVGLLCPHARADVGQVLYRERGPRLESVHDASADRVVTAETPAGGASGQPLQVPSGTPGAPSLELPAEAEVAGLQLAPAPLAVEAVVAGRGGALRCASSLRFPGRRTRPNQPRWNNASFGAQDMRPCR